MPVVPTTVEEFIKVLETYPADTPLLFAKANDQTQLTSAVAITDNDTAPTWDGNNYMIFNEKDCDEYLPAGAIHAVVISGV